jgi:hypothetical protein
MVREWRNHDHTRQSRPGLHVTGADSQIEAKALRSETLTGREVEKFR